MALSTPLVFATSLVLLSFLVIASATGYGSVPTPKVDEKHPNSPKVDEKYPKSSPKVDEKYPKVPKVDEKYPKVPKTEEKFPKIPNGFKQVVPEDVYSKLVPKTIGIQGTILCKSGLTSFPIKGAVTRIACLSEDEYGYETAPFSILSGASDANGYFFATLSPSQLKDKFKLTECKAFLDYSPLESCKVPCDVNQGVGGHTLSSYRTLNANIKLYSVGPFFYTPAPTAPAASAPTPAASAYTPAAPKPVSNNNNNKGY